MNLSPAELAVFGTLGGTLIGALSATAIAFINKKSEEKKHFRELVVKTATEYWKHVSVNSASPIMPPLTDYIVHMVKMCELALDKDINANNVKPKLAEIAALVSVLQQHSLEISKLKSKQQ